MIPSSDGIFMLSKTISQTSSRLAYIEKTFLTWTCQLINNESGVANKKSVLFVNFVGVNLSKTFSLQPIVTVRTVHAFKSTRRFS